MRLETSYVDVALPKAMKDYATAKMTEFAYAYAGGILALRKKLSGMYRVF